MRSGITMHIGFANEYYTLWRITQFHNGRYWTVNYFYVQNLAKTEELAVSKFLERYPNEDPEVDYGLRGTASWEVIVVDKERFRKGKYQYMKFEECEDVDYMTWYYDTFKRTGSDIERCENLKKLLEEKHGCKITARWDGDDEPRMMTPERIKKMKARKRAKKAIKKGYGFHDADGERKEFKLNIVEVRTIDTDFGLQYKLVMRERGSGKVYFYFGGSGDAHEICQGFKHEGIKKVELKGTVEHRHDDYIDADVTYLKRPKFNLNIY